jgi:hypothetical protein
LKLPSDFSISYLAVAFSRTANAGADVDDDGDEGDDLTFPPGMDPALMQQFMAGHLK